MKQPSISFRTLVRRSESRKTSRMSQKAEGIEFPFALLDVVSHPTSCLINSRFGKTNAYPQITPRSSEAIA